MAVTREDEFFANFPDYKSSKTASTLENFHALAIKRQWGVGSKTWRRQWEACFGTAYNPEQAPLDEEPRNSIYKEFPGFKPNHSATVHQEFIRFAAFKNLKKDTAEWNNYRGRFFEEEFAAHFGSDANKLANWQNLCSEVGLPAGASITQCKKILKGPGVHFNLVNLVNRRRNPAIELKRFKNYKEFVDYTRRPGNVYPKAAAKKDGFLKALLRQVF